MVNKFSLTIKIEFSDFQGQLLLFKIESSHDMQKEHRSNTVLEEIILDLDQHLARLAWLIQEYLFSVKK